MNEKISLFWFTFITFMPIIMMAVSDIIIWIKEKYDGRH
jgi:hypothetical protein